MKKLFVFLLLAISYSISAYAETPHVLEEDSGANITFKIFGNHGDDKQLLVEYNGKTYKGMTSYIIDIDGVKDFNSDGVGDAVVDTSDGGNGIPPEYYFVTVINDTLIMKLITDDWGDISLTSLDGKPVVKQKTVDSTRFVIFDGKDVVVVKQQAQLKALKEITGVGAMYGGPLKEKKLVYDLNEDGKKDVIECSIWQRWGSLVCSFPLPNGKSTDLSTGYDRVGVLETMKNGYHEIVGNNDDIYYFNGKAWVLKK